MMGTKIKLRAIGTVSIYMAERAVIELKRQGVELLSADELRRISYASLLHPRPPLVVKQHSWCE
jgi:hypothetical protein